MTTRPFRCTPRCALVFVPLAAHAVLACEAKTVADAATEGAADAGPSPPSGIPCEERAAVDCAFDGSPAGIERAVGQALKDSCGTRFCWGIGSLLGTDGCWTTDASFPPSPTRPDCEQQFLETHRFTCAVGRGHVHQCYAR